MPTFPPAKGSCLIGSFSIEAWNDVADFEVLCGGASGSHAAWAGYYGCYVAPSPPVPNPRVGGLPGARSLERIIARRPAGGWIPVASPPAPGAYAAKGRRAAMARLFASASLRPSDVPPCGSPAPHHGPRPPPRPLHAGERLAPDVSDRQPSHLDDRPPAGLHGPSRRREPAADMRTVGHVGAWVAGKPRLASWRPWREAVVSGPDGVAVFDALHRCHRAIDALLYAFDLPELDGEDLRPPPLSARKAKLLVRKPAGIVFNEHAEEDGAVVFWHACKMGLEGIVSKRLAAPYRSGPSRLEALATAHRNDFEHQRDRNDRIMAELLKLTADLMTAKEMAARLNGELSAIRARPWWRRMAALGAPVEQLAARHASAPTALD
jgi:hypothetical protein